MSGFGGMRPGGFSGFGGRRGGLSGVGGRRGVTGFGGKKKKSGFSTSVFLSSKEPSFLLRKEVCFRGGPPGRRGGS